MVPVAADPTSELDKRDAVDEPGWRRVKAEARQRLNPPPRGRASRPAALRDLAMVLMLGECGRARLTSARCPATGRCSSRALKVRAVAALSRQGRKERRIPLSVEVEDAIAAWRDARDRIYEPAEPLVFPRLGRPTRDGVFSPTARRASANSHTLHRSTSCGR